MPLIAKPPATAVSKCGNRASVLALGRRLFLCRFTHFHLRFRYLLPAFQDDKAQGDIQGNGSKNLLQVSGRAVFVPEGGMESWDRSPFFTGAFAAHWCQREGTFGRGGQEADLTAKQQESLCSEWGAGLLSIRAIRRLHNPPCDATGSPRHRGP